MKLPAALARYEAAITASVRPMLAGTTTARFDEPRCTSHLGGEPLWPKDTPFPRDRHGVDLQLLVQLYFDELPVLAPLPRHGLLQLFIGTDDLYGCGFGREGHQGFAAVFHPTPAQIVPRRAPSRAAPACSPLNHDHAVGLRFALDQMPVSPSDYRLATLVPGLDDDDDAHDAYDALPVPAIRIGGYPTFTQSDPRGGAGLDADFNLFTLDTCDAAMWGDSGVGQFMMSAAALARGDFAGVFYNWDCC